MGDKLTELYDKWKADNSERGDDQFTSFQAGFTAGAVSMRERAMEVVRVIPDVIDKNVVINSIGSLPDIPA